MNVGLGTRLRRLLAELDGGVQATYDSQRMPFRPRFFPIVQALLESKMLGVNAIAEAAQVSQPAATSTLKEMQRLDLIEIVAGEDRRERRVRLSPRGRRLAKRLQPVWEATERAAAELDAELPAGLSETVDRALAALSARPFGTRVQDELGKKP